MLFRTLALAGALCFAAVLPAASQSISSSETQTCALSASGELYCWGQDLRKPGKRIRTDSAPMPMVDSTLRFVSVGVGATHACAITTAGKAMCWGSPIQGELGRDAAAICSGCGLDTVESPLRFRSVVAGMFHSCALAVDRRAYCSPLSTLHSPLSTHRKVPGLTS